MLLVSIIYTLSNIDRQISNYDITLSDARHLLVVVAKSLSEIIQKTDPVLSKDMDLLVGSDYLAIMCGYEEDIRMFIQFMEKAASVAMQSSPDSMEHGDSVPELPTKSLLESLESEQEMSSMIDQISNIAPTNDKLAWKRLNKELSKHLAKYDDINNSYVELKIKRTLLIKTIADMREKMVNECIHPKEELVFSGDYVLCKFCEKRLKLTK